MKNNYETKISSELFLNAIKDVIEMDKTFAKLAEETKKIDNIVRVNGNSFTDYDKAIEYISKIKGREVEKWYLYDVDLFGIGYAIMKWCQTNDKYYHESILKSALDNYSEKSNSLGSNFGEDVLRFYKKILSLRQYKGLVYEGLSR